MSSSSIGNLWADVRYGVRQLRRSPAFTLVGVSALGIGVAANITIFSFVSAWLLQPKDAAPPKTMCTLRDE